MALQKEFTSKGFTVSYWIVSEKRWEKRTNQTSCMLLAYKDKAQRDAGLSNNITELTKSFSFAGDLEIAELYTKIKALPISPMVTGIYNADFIAKNYISFTDATDC